MKAFALLSSLVFLAGCGGGGSALAGSWRFEPTFTTFSPTNTPTAGRLLFDVTVEDTELNDAVFFSVGVCRFRAERIKGGNKAIAPADQACTVGAGQAFPLWVGGGTEQVEVVLDAATLEVIEPNTLTLTFAAKGVGETTSAWLSFGPLKSVAQK